MAEREDVLRKYTLKGETDSLERRVFYCIDEIEDKERRQHVTEKLLSIMFAKIVEKHNINEDEVDDMLLEIFY